MIQTKWGELLVITQKQCRDLITDAEVLKLVEQVLADYANGDAVNPIKVHLPFFPDYNGWNNAMPGWLKKQDIHGIKWAGFGFDNAAKFGVPCCSAVIVLNDMETAFPVALLDGTTVMAMRTGAAAAVMAKYNVKKSAKVATLLGAGVQGTSGMEMILLALPQLEEVRVMDLFQSQIDKCIAALKAKFPKIKFVGTTDKHAACKGTDLVLTAVHNPDPAATTDVLDDVEFENGVTVVTIAGGMSSTKYPKVFDRIVMDFAECLCHRHNVTIDYMKQCFNVDVQPMSADICDAEIGDIILGKAIGRTNDEEKVYCTSVGMGIEDLIVANDIYQKAKARDIGQVISVIDDIGQ